jgi:hypothetical protein
MTSSMRLRRNSLDLASSSGIVAQSISGSATFRIRPAHKLVDTIGKRGVQGAPSASSRQDRGQTDVQRGRPGC